MNLFTSEDMSNDMEIGMLNENADLDCLFFREQSNKHAQNLTRRMSPRTGCKHAKEQHENSLSRLSSLGLCNISTVANRNKKHWFFKSCH